MSKSATKIPMPEPVIRLHDAQQSLQKFYSHTKLKFTLDGRLVGDIAEVLASIKFGIKLSEKRVRGVDGYVGGRSVQIKATQFDDKGPAFSPGEGVADHLIFLFLNFKDGQCTVVYNGPESPVRKKLPIGFIGTKRVQLADVLEIARQTPESDMLPPVT